MGRTGRDAIPPVALADAFEVDGSLRDIVVLDTDVAMWNTMLAFVAELPGARFSIDRETAPMPSDCAPLFPMLGDHRVLLEVPIGTTRLHCHFFWDGEIELDLPPRDVASAEQAIPILDFMTSLAEAVDHPVHLTPENWREYAFLSFDPASESWSWATSLVS